ncbi:hypothetical protein LTS07_003449 [Exophiala sideris]|uniref:Xylanolytic transcriptional activator regulatory domain-containing protein n=1 Tax=Exophiala sideris TaxID=1016849 RepID=A0ABR0JJ72_9EURO|nr:hypothetical protein LTS07_003449 [Exophiala sideris]KAK5042824.1 hypothetical protein LTR13_001672 [Exophiala sideris]KAK5065907.1 hypothetical protein LTR69_003457 [Exophiala sideris]
MLTRIARHVARAHLDSLDERMRKLEELLTKQRTQSKEKQSIDSKASDRTSPTNEQGQTQQDVQKPCSSCSDSEEDTDIDIDQSRPVEYEAPSTSGDFRVLGQKSVASDDSPESTTSSHNFLKQMVSAPGHWSYNETSGRLRYFGATTDFDIYSGVSPGPHVLDSREQERYGISVLKDVPPSVQDYLMDLYWKCFNSVIFVVHKEAFIDDQKRGHHGQYSAFLHITILAMGMRFADSSRPEISHLMLGSGGESRLQREARRLLEYELETPGGVPSVQALLILGDMEFAIGRENTGWMYVATGRLSCQMS